MRIMNSNGVDVPPFHGAVSIESCMQCDELKELLLGV